MTLARDAPTLPLWEELQHHWTDADSQRHLDAALIRKAWLQERGDPNGRHHEPLEWFGDRVLDLVVGKELLRRFPGREEGAYDATRARLVGETNLAQIAREFGVLDQIRMGRGERLQGQVEEDKPLSDHLEALCGAAFLSGGWDGAEAFVLRLFEGAWPDELRAARLDDHTEGGALPPMSELSQLVNRIWATSLDPVEDWEVEESGPDHQRVHVASVTFPPEPGSGERVTVAGPPVRGKKKKAKAAAAREALPYLRDLASG